MKTNKDSKTSSNSKAKIDTYPIDIYSCDLVVANQYTTVEQLKELYCFYDGVELSEDIMDGNASTSKCKDIKTGKAVALVKFNRNSAVKGVDKTLSLINIISHEAAHVALDIYELCNQHIYFGSPEPFCYLQGWACECIYKTLKK